MEPVILIAALWIASAVAGAVAGSGRNAMAFGGVLGLILGPIGVIAALGVDNRELCPRCTGRLDIWKHIEVTALCQHCGTELAFNTWGVPRVAGADAKEVSVAAPIPARSPYTCARCKTELPPDASSCRGCGAQIAWRDGQPHPISDAPPPKVAARPVPPPTRNPTAR